MKTIPLTRGLIVTVDDEDYEELSKYCWYAQKAHGTYYAYRDTRDKNGNGRIIAMHREICKTRRYVDHKDGNGLNNLRSNLRPATDQQNKFNTRKQDNCTSIYKGVRWYRGKWRVTIQKNRKQINLGRFVDEIEAAKAYNEAALKLFGDFARLNGV